jgi:hypothetical protein
MRTRRLTLKREDLTALASDELAGIAGAGADSRTLPLVECYLSRALARCDSVIPCNTNPCTS